MVEQQCPAGSHVVLAVDRIYLDMCFCYFLLVKLLTALVLLRWQSAEVSTSDNQFSVSETFPLGGTPKYVDTSRQTKSRVVTSIVCVCRLCMHKLCSYYSSYFIMFLYNSFVVRIKLREELNRLKRKNKRNE
jgi:hypothetical protein